MTPQQARERKFAIMKQRSHPARLDHAQQARAVVSAATKTTAQAFLAAELPAAEPVYRVSDIDTKPAPLDKFDLSKLERYDLTHFEMGAYMADCAEGEYVRFDDVQSLLATKPAAAPEAKAIYQVQFITESGSSAWHDASKDAYDTFMPERRRTVYAAPTAAPAEQVQWRNIQKVVRELAKFCFGEEGATGSVSLDAARTSLINALTAKDGLKVALDPLSEPASAGQAAPADGARIRGAALRQR